MNLQVMTNAEEGKVLLLIKSMVNFVVLWYIGLLLRKY